MIDYFATFITNGVAFPNTQAINVTAPGAADGTQITAISVNDMWGARQALMDNAGLSPNGVSEATGNSQFLTALQYSFMPPGAVIGWYGDTYPSTLGYRFLPLIGQGILRASYPDLDAAIYCGDPKNGIADYNYHADDAGGASRNTAGIYLILPDLQGRFLRCYDAAGAVDPDPSRILQSYQDQDVAAHWHDIRDNAIGDPIRLQSFQEGTGSAISVAYAALSGSPEIYASNAPSDMGPATYNFDETRPVNANIVWCIKY